MKITITARHVTFIKKALGARNDNEVEDMIQKHLEHWLGYEATLKNQKKKTTAELIDDVVNTP